MKAYFKHVLAEMAVPRESDLAKTYYHGTYKVKDASDILKNGIKAPDLTGRNEKLTPRKGKVYITSHLRTAQIYAIGGDVAGSDSPYAIPNDIHYAPFGFLFVIDGKDLKDIEPDEDNVGELIWQIQLDYKKGIQPSVEQRTLLDLARIALTPRQLQRVFQGEYGDWAVAGKKIIPKLSDEMKLWLIDQPNVHIAHHGTIFPKEAWQIDLHKIPQLKPDASNFFQIAEKIK